MSIREIVRSDFEEFIRVDPSVPEGLRRSLRLTERVPAFLDNLTRELQACDEAGLILDRFKIKSLVYNMASMFVHCLKTRADEMEMSDVARTCARTAIEGDDIIKKFDKDGNADLTEELGIIIKDKE